MSEQSPKDSVVEDIVLDPAREELMSAFVYQNAESVPGMRSFSAENCLAGAINEATSNLDCPGVWMHEHSPLSAIEAIDAHLKKETGTGVTPQDLVAKNSHGIRPLEGLMNRTSFEIIKDRLWKGQQWFTADQLLQQSRHGGTLLGPLASAEEEVAEFALSPELWQGRLNDLYRLRQRFAATKYDEDKMDGVLQEAWDKVKGFEISEDKSVAHALAFARDHSSKVINDLRRQLNWNDRVDKILVVIDSDPKIKAFLEKAGQEATKIAPSEGVEEIT